MKQDEIRLAEMLAMKYGTLQSHSKEIGDREFALQKARDTKGAPRLNQPEVHGSYVIFAILAAVALFIIDGLVYLMLWAGAYTYANKALPFLLGLPLVAATIILFAGAMRGKAEMQEHNAAAAREEEGRQKKIETLQHEIDDLRTQAQALQTELDAYSDRVPENMRTRNRMMQVKTQLQTGTSQTFDEAISHMNK
ncbi:MAG: hypothetical protein J5750_09210 [Clostridiales bacterium]|nr:hypothetical protein [Clostridiales bacterium]